jgi:AcrR family transcriptional regulator
MLASRSIDLQSALCGSAPVSRVTLPERHTKPRRRYVSGKRGAQAAHTRAQLLKAVLDLVREGQFRASSRQITDRAGVHHGSINYHYGHESLFYRVVAREHWRDVAPCLPFVEGLDSDAEEAAVWAVLVGEPRALS